MTINLSFFEARRPTRGIENFYTDLHDAMNDRGPVADAPFPSAQEFKQFLAREYPNGMDGLRCLDAGRGGTAINSRTLVAARAGTVIAVDLNRGSLQLVRASLLERCGSVVEDTFISAFDRFHGRTLGPWSMTGDGLLRIFLCRPAPAAE